MPLFIWKSLAYSFSIGTPTFDKIVDHGAQRGCILSITTSSCTFLSQFSFISEQNSILYLDLDGIFEKWAFL